jgi:hypothetical protein
MNPSNINIICRVIEKPKFANTGKIKFIFDRDRGLHCDNNNGLILYFIERTLSFNLLRELNEGDYYRFKGYCYICAKRGMSNMIKVKSRFEQYFFCDDCPNLIKRGINNYADLGSIHLLGSVSECVHKGLYVVNQRNAMELVKCINVFDMLEEMLNSINDFGISPYSSGIVGKFRQIISNLFHKYLLIRAFIGEDIAGVIALSIVGSARKLS